MTTTELEQVIQDYFLDIYNKRYIGKLEIIKLDPQGYCIKFGMDRPYLPTILYAELNDKEFLEYLKTEIKNMRLNLIQYEELNLTYPYNCCQPNTSCKCNDT